MTQPRGTFCLVLHTHLPWLPHHGAWPVGEEWLYQAWADSYLHVFSALDRLQQRGHQEVATVGLTPILAAQLDDSYSLAGMSAWLHNAQLRAWEMTTSHDRTTRELGLYEATRQERNLEVFSAWSRGGSAVVRPLVAANTIELLGGPAAHPFQPFLDPQVLDFSLQTGLADTKIRLGSSPQGIWAPECAYRPGLEDHYQHAGISHFVTDGPTFRHVGRDTHLGAPVGNSDVVAFARDLDVTYRVWSPRRGYPGGKWYRDFHAHTNFGFRHKRVTHKDTAAEEKAPYDAARASAAIQADVADFVDTVGRRLDRIHTETGAPGLSVAAFDTELFGHWWLEGPQWLEAVIPALTAANIDVTTLAGARERGLVGNPIHPQSSSWGAGKDWHVWEVDPIMADHAQMQGRVLDYLKGLDLQSGRSPVADQLVQELILGLASDWAFMVTKDSAANYAWQRHNTHRDRLHQIADAVVAEGWDGQRPTQLAREFGASDRPFGHLDARSLARH